MITISPWRSAKWCGLSCQPADLKKYGPPMSSTSASAQSAPCSVPSANEALTSSPLAIPVEIARPMTDERRLGWSRLASMKSAMCAIRTTP